MNRTNSMSEMGGSAGVSRMSAGVLGKVKRFPLGVQTFREVRECTDFYVDKTRFAFQMASEDKYVFLSRPRRFGKSLFLDTLLELFQGNEELFRGLYVHDRWDWSVKYPVIRLSFSGGDFVSLGGLQRNVNAQLFDIEKRTVGVGSYDGLPCDKRLEFIIKDLYENTGQRVVVLVDEYDKPMLNATRNPEVKQANRDFLHGFYGVLKDADRYLRFVFLTGVTKFAKVSLFSGLNNAEDITLLPEYSSICGFTEAELDRVFADELEGLDRDKIRAWYNGYNWLGTEKVYNPHDILTLLEDRVFGDHWFETATPTFLVDMLTNRGVSTLSLEGKWATGKDLLASFNEKIKTEALMFQTGYLTITDMKKHRYHVSYKLDYPNLEVRRSLNQALLVELIDTPPEESVYSDMLTILENGDTTGLKAMFDKFFASIPYQWHTKGKAANYESYYATVFHICFTALDVEVIAEDSTNTGRIDITVKLPQRTWIFEFKTTNTPTTHQPTTEQTTNQPTTEQPTTTNQPATEQPTYHRRTCHRTANYRRSTCR